MAPHGDEKSGVVDDRAFRFVETQTLRDPKRNEALAEHVLHGLPEPQIDAERESRHELGEAKRLAFGRRGGRHRWRRGYQERRRNGATESGRHYPRSLGLPSRLLTPQNDEVLARLLMLEQLREVREQSRPSPL